MANFILFGMPTFTEQLFLFLIVACVVAVPVAIVIVVVKASRKN